MKKLRPRDQSPGLSNSQPYISTVPPSCLHLVSGSATFSRRSWLWENGKDAFISGPENVGFGSAIKTKVIQQVCMDDFLSHQYFR